METLSPLLVLCEENLPITPADFPSEGLIIRIFDVSCDVSLIKSK